MFRKLKLYGELAKFIGHKEFEVQVNTLQKAISFLVNNFPEVEKYMNTKHYQVKVGNYEIDKTELNYPIGQEDIHIVPVIAGAGGVGKTILGVGLVGLAFATGGVTGAAFFKGAAVEGSFAAAGFMTKAAVSIGGALALQGVSEMLFPLPKPKEFMSEQDPKLSFNFSGTQNTSRAGTPVPIVYGEIITGSVVISGSVDTHQVVA
jgi:predicted phage tail protein|tara:strand:- start:1004 stop:1618 length:615 start_codon:yes stop_codon:yes gene_type:complete